MIDKARAKALLGNGPFQVGDRVVVRGEHGMAGMCAVVDRIPEYIERVDRVAMGNQEYVLVRFTEPEWAKCSPYAVAVGSLHKFDIIESLSELEEA